MSDLSIIIVEELKCFWLKTVCGCDFHRVTWTFQAVQDWLTQPRIQTFVSACQRSSFLYAYTCDSSSGAFVSYPRFPYQPRTVNKWFSVPVKSDGKERKINVINVDQDGKTRKCYTTQNQCKNFPWSLEDLEGFEVFYHGTKHEAAKNIMTDAIDLVAGKLERDFSSGNGFYLGKNFDDALGTKFASNRPPTSAVLVFLVKKDNLRGPKLNMKGLTLEDDKEWKKVVKLFRTEQDRKPVKEIANDEKSREAIGKNDFIEGPMASDKGNFEHPEAIDWSYQLCVRSQKCADLFDQSLHSVLFFS